MIQLFRHTCGKVLQAATAAGPYYLDSPPVAYGPDTDLRGLLPLDRCPRCLAELTPATVQLYDPTPPDVIAAWTEMQARQHGPPIDTRGE